MSATNETVTILAETLLDLVRDAYEEAIDEPEDEDTGTRQHWSRSKSKAQVERFLTEYGITTPKAK